MLKSPVGDADKVAADKAALAINFNGETAGSVTQNLSLPSTGSSGSSIAWSSSNKAVISDAGVVTRQSSDVDVTLTATISKNLVSDTKPFQVTVVQTDLGAVADSKAALALGYANGDSAVSVTQGLSLPASGVHGVAVAWSSDSQSFVSNGGAVTRPVTGGDRTVVLTATISKNQASDTKVFQIVVLQTDAGAVADAKADLAIGYGSGDSAAGVSGTISLPTTGIYGTTISWVSDTQGVVTNGGAVTRPTSGTDATVGLTATIRQEPCERHEILPDQGVDDADRRGSRGRG